jgi:hypothetical protein
MIKNDITAGLLKLGVEDRRGFAKLNKAIITFIRKKHDAGDRRLPPDQYRPRLLKALLEGSHQSSEEATR